MLPVYQAVYSRSLGVCRPHDWGGKELNAHVFFNPEKEMKERNELFGYVTSLARQAATTFIIQRFQAPFLRVRVLYLYPMNGAFVRSESIYSPERI